MRAPILSLLALLFSITAFGTIGPIAGPFGVCAGTTITLTDTTAGGSWSSNDLSVATVNPVTGVVTGVANGIVTITYSSGVEFAITNVTVNPLPLTYYTGGGGSMCAGSAGLHVDLSGSSAGITYTLLNYGAAVSTIPGSGGPLDFGPQTNAGMYTIMATNPSTGCHRTMTGSAIINVNPVPGPITGPSFLCPGTTITVTDGGVYGGTWSSSAPYIAGISLATGIVTGLSSGSSTITYTDITTGCFTSISVTVGIGPPPISIPSSVCLGSSTAVTDGMPGGAWTSGDPSIALIAPFTGIITPVALGTVTISYSLGTSCVATHPITVVPAIAPITGPTATCVGSTIYESDSAGPGSWNIGNPSIASYDFMTGGITGITPGATNLTFISSSGCSTSKTISVYTGSCSGTPVGGTIAAAAYQVCANSPVVLSLSGASSGCGIRYQWQNSSDNSLFTSIPGATDDIYQLNPVERQYYRCEVICVSTGFAAYSTSHIIGVYNKISAHSVLNVSDTFCSIPDFMLQTCGWSPTANVTTWFGDGTSVNMPVSAGSNSADFMHSYQQPGTFTIKQVLYNGIVAQDSILYSYEFNYCRNLPVKFFFDANSNCTFDSGEQLLRLPVKTEIDSNGIPVDTISSTSGFYYKAFGGPGTVYGFRVIETPASLHITCPASGIVYDTILPALNNSNLKYFGLNCSGTAFDLSMAVSTTTGRHRQLGTIIVNNSSCLPDDIILKLQFSPKYNYANATPAPTSISGNIATWNFTGVTAATLPVINYWLELPYSLPFLLLTDTINSTYSINGVLGGIDTTNNIITKNDTVRASLDPNEISVSPGGAVMPCTQLQYTIRFENTGNDTARNIYIMDTLSGSLDFHSLNIDAASAVMSYTLIKDGTYTIAKFDFPGVNLPDSSHNNLAEGMVVFNIKTKPGLPDGANIKNQAGIFFDDNPAVLTNIVSTAIGINPLLGNSEVCDGAHDTLFNQTKGGMWSCTNGSASILNGVVTGLSTGLDTIQYTIANICAVRTISKTISVITMPEVAAISGANRMCAGESVTLTDTTSGGRWNVDNMVVAVISSVGNINGIAAGIAIISYSVSNTCGTTTATAPLIVNPLPGIISGNPNICIGHSEMFGDDSSGGIWSSSYPPIAAIDSGTGLIYGAASGNVLLRYTIPNGCFRELTVTVNQMPAAYTVTGGGSYCFGGTGVNIGLNGSGSGLQYLLYEDTVLMAIVSGTGTSIEFGPQTNIGSYSVTAYDSVSTCRLNMEDSAIVNVIPSVVPAVNISITPGDTICSGSGAAFSASSVNGGSDPVYLWFVNGLNQSADNSFSYLPVSGDIVKVILKSNAICASPDTVSRIANLTIEIPSQPLVSIFVSPDTIANYGKPVTYTAVVSGSSGPVAYQWVINKTYIAGATNASFTSDTLRDNDSVACVISTSNSCGTVITEKTIAANINTLDVHQLNLNPLIIIYPNPANFNITIENASNCFYSLLNILGQELFSDKINSNKEVLATCSFNPGIYILRIKDADGAIINKRFIKE